MAGILLGGIVKGVASGVGLVSESIHDHNERKKAKAYGSVVDGEAGHGARHADRETPTLEEGDEEHWELDEAQDELTGVHSHDSSMSLSKHDQISPTKVTDAFIRRCPVPEKGVPARLPLPVVLPQRRPKDRSRGFIRAYAPDLAAKEIDQHMFLDFIETFNMASQANPWLNAINLAGLATWALPPDVQTRERQNTFLDRINDEFFQPRGLYCLVLTWQPDSTELHTPIDLNATIAQREEHVHGMDKLKRNMKTGSAVGDVEFTECATLVFPKLDELADQHGPDADSKKAKLRHYKAFSETYFDRRAQAKLPGKNPSSFMAKLNGPTPKFTSRYADPNNPASNGNLFSLLSGGLINTGPPLGTKGSQLGGGLLGNRGGGFGRSNSGGLFGSRRQDDYGSDYQQPYQQQQGYYDEQGYYHQAHSSQQQQGMGSGYSDDSDRGGFGGTGGPLDGLVGTILGGGVGGANPIRRILKKNVLYLMVVNMPTEQELAAGHEFARRAAEQGGSHTAQDFRY
ncbi:hypothetical protein EDD37DRAFT_649834 [Exophiala viscosa]|uniref:Uncharacterized protein n=1 Tax=Exophiala viscosa TaxID=2486360 RepID=A0AAN6DZK5_9EURO|nr:hypothetical protein EDD36DRAFT_485457 [Exophiala viscosa]KAI1623937.1 hypothetical protein EDD37DRAFT_649834 [Exophiala viscosa]